MYNVSQSECKDILKSYLQREDFELIKFTLDVASDASVGLMSSVSKLLVDIRVDGESKRVKFFIKFLPQSDFHLGIATKACCFKKESAFFGDMFKEMRKYLVHKSIPTCYLENCEKMIVLEDLCEVGYKNYSNSLTFDIRHIYASIKALADIHAASLLYEQEINTTFDKILPYEILRPWFTEIEGYPGYNENLAAASGVKYIIGKYFKHYPENVRNKAMQLCLDYSRNNKMSKKYRNVITHQDLWCNNLMFKYKDDCVEGAVIIDFQMYGYNPPTFDLLVMIYCNTDKAIRDQHLDKFLDYYYNCLSENFQHHKVDPKIILSYEEFKDSMEETLPSAVCAAPLFQPLILMPDHELTSIINDVERFRMFMSKDRIIILELMEKYVDYRKSVNFLVEDLLNFVADHLVN